MRHSNLSLAALPYRSWSSKMDKDMCGTRYPRCMFMVWGTVSMQRGVCRLQRECEMVMVMVRGEGCPSPPPPLLAADWLMLLSGQRVPGEDEEPRVICGGFYKQRQAWKWWEEILAKGRNDKSIRNAFLFSLFSSPLHSPCWRNSCCYNSTVHGSLHSHATSERPPSQAGLCAWGVNMEMSKYAWW